ncbi:MAG: hypothetical protein J6Z31_04060 [Fibrobacter sp.]|nr:hypothetical protein [Fibrobacter sp.]
MLRKLCLAVLIFATLLFAEAPVAVEAYDEQASDPNQVTLRIRLTNHTEDTLQNVRLRYFLDYEKGRDLTLSPYYLPGATLSIDTLDFCLAVNINFSKLAPGVFPNDAGMSLGLYYSDYGPFDKDENFSYPGTDSFVDAKRIAVYLEGVLIAGESPTDRDVPQIRISAFQPEKAARGQWVKLKNVGERSVDLKYLSVSDSLDRHTLGESVGNRTLVPGDTLLVCVSSPCDGDLELPNLSLGNAGELTVAYGAILTDYVAWGKSGGSSSEAVSKNLWSNSEDFLQTGKSLGPSLPYAKGSFFRRADLQQFSSFAWMLYSQDEIHKADGELPNSAPFSWNDGSKIVLPENATMHFAWMPVPGSKSYRLNVYSGDTSLVYRQITSELSADAALPDGKYLWKVESSSDEATWGATPASEGRLYEVEKLSASLSYQDQCSLDVEPIAARKDTRLLVTNWGMFADIRGWDESHVGHAHWDEEESWRCWAVAIQELNRYFGGNLTQDEIKFRGMDKKAAGKIIHKEYAMWRNGGAEYTAVREILPDILGGTSVVYHDSTPTEEWIRQSIDEGLPLYVATTQHAMVIDAYRVRSDGRMETRFLNPHNDGGSEWQVFSSAGIVSYFTYERPTRVLNTDSLIHLDSDGDGLMDYDETDRFGTDPYKADSDGDGIPDKTEIWSHTIRESVRWMAASDDSSQNPVDMLNGALIVGVEKELFSDSDGDGMCAELDIDSDGDGIRDGDEDLNGNGIVEEGETDPYIANGGGLPVHAEDDVPGDFALYSLGKLSLNDGSECRYKANLNSSNSECALASESSAEYFAVSLAGGKQSVVHSKGGVLVRNRDSVNTVNIYSDKEVKPTLNVQKGASVIGYAYLPEQNWVWSVNSNLEPIDVGNQEKIVRSGEVFLLLDGAKIRTLKVEAGGTLLMGTGEMYVGSLQLESGSVVDFTEYGYATVLHVNETVIWRGGVNLNGLRGDGILERLYSIACGFKLIYHGNETLFIEGDWSGTLFAPKAKLVLGQATKSLYGRFVGNGITVHQYATLHVVHFDPQTKTAIAYFNMEEK